MVTAETMEDKHEVRRINFLMTIKEFQSFVPLYRKFAMIEIKYKCGTCSNSGMEFNLLLSKKHSNLRSNQKLSDEFLSYFLSKPLWTMYLHFLKNAIERLVASCMRC